MNDNLPSMNKLEQDIKSMKLFSIFLNPEQRKQIKEIEKQLNHLCCQFETFNKYFSDYGWCAYDSMNSTLIESANKAFENGGVEAGEKFLIDYYSEDVKDLVYQLKAKSNSFMERYYPIQNAFSDHFAGRYYASVPQFLIIIDGAVNDFTKSKGFFAEGTDVTAWDCLVGCSDGLTKLKEVFNKGRNKTNVEEIRLPYRNGILHGRDLNYGNIYVSCKCVALLFALADWMSFKDSEEIRKEKYEKETNPPPISESLKEMQQVQRDKEEISRWKRKDVIIGTNIPSIPCVEDCTEFPYIIPLIKMFDAWNKKNYGLLSVALKNMFLYAKSEKMRAGECRKLFASKEFVSYELKEIEEQACSLTRVLVQANWKVGELLHSESLEFGCIYQSEQGRAAYPWKGNGQWIIKPWRVQGLYKLI